MMLWTLWVGNCYTYTWYILCLPPLFASLCRFFMEVLDKLCRALVFHMICYGFSDLVGSPPVVPIGIEWILAFVRSDSHQSLAEASTHAQVSA